MNNHDFKQTVEEAAKKIGIDMIGFASKARFENVDPQHNPFSIFPEGKTVILLGKRICRLDHPSRLHAKIGIFYGTWLRSPGPASLRLVPYLIILYSARKMFYGRLNVAKPRAIYPLVSNRRTAYRAIIFLCKLVVKLISVAKAEPGYKTA